MTYPEQAPTESKTRLPLSRLAIVGLALGNIGLALTACTFGGGMPEKERPTKQQRPAQAPEKGATKSETRATPEKEDPTKEWTSVLELGGNASQRSGVFELKTGKIRLTSDVKGTGIFFDVYVMEEGKPIGQGVTPNVSLVEAGIDASALSEDPGKYYVEVTAIDAEWTVKIEEQR